MNWFSIDGSRRARTMLAHTMVVRSVTVRLGIVGCVLLLSACVLEQRPTPIQEMSAQRMVDRGVGFLRAGDRSAARAAFALAVEIAPIASALDGLGCVELADGHEEEAAKLFLEAFSRDRRYLTSLVNLAFLREAQGRKEDAIALLRFTLERDPANYRARNNLGVILGVSGTIVPAREQLTTAFAAKEDPLVARNLTRLGSSEADSGE